MLWTSFIILTAVVLFFVSRPLFSKADIDMVGEPVNADVEVYRDQLAEIDADLERGLLGEEEAISARTEVSRRLLKHSGKHGGDTVSDKASTGTHSDNNRAVVFAALAAIPALALSIYVYVGSPKLPGQPHAMRMAKTTKAAPIDVLVAKAEVQLRAHPDQGQGWDVLAPIYLRQGRYDKAVEAYGRALDLLGENPRRLSGYAAALISQNNGIVNEGALRAFGRLNVLQPGRSDVQFWLAVAKEQDGKLGLAVKEFRSMLKNAPADAPWRGMVERKLQDVEQRIAGGASRPVIGGGGQATVPGSRRAPGATSGANTQSTSGPSASDIAAAGKMSAGDRQAMINQMVARLADRLKDKGDDLKGWQRLVSAYLVLGKTEKAKQALTDARANFAGNSVALGMLDSMAKRF